MNPAAETSQAPRQEWALTSYLAAIRAHAVVVLLVTLAAVGAALAFLQVRSPSYEATAELLVEPLPQDDETFTGLSALIRDTGDPTRTAQTAAALVASRAAADAAAGRLGDEWTGRSVLAALEVNPEGESNILGITATAGDPDEAARVANEFSRAALEVRADELERQVDTLIAQLESRLKATPTADQVTRATLASRIDQLNSVLETGDPTLRLSQGAVPPVSATGVPGPVVVLLAAIGGLVLGSGAALLLEVITRRVGDEEEAAGIYPIPVLARVPTVSARAMRGPVRSRWYMPPEIREPYRTVGVLLEQRERGPNAVMITSPTAGDGKTTSAINLAVSLAATGRQVALLDLDLRKPDVGPALGLHQGRRIYDIVDPNLGLADLLIRPSDLSTLSVLAGEFHPEDIYFADGANHRLPQLIQEARELAEYVIIDTPPLGEVSDALRLARAVDDIVIVIRPGNSTRDGLTVVRDLLERSGYEAEGAIIIGSERPPRGSAYYAYGQSLFLDGDREFILNDSPQGFDGPHAERAEKRAS